MKYGFLLLDYETSGLDETKDYPIEIGGMFLSSDLKILDLFEYMIGWEDLKDSILKNNNEWPEENLESYNIHKISVLEYFTTCAPNDWVAEKLIEMSENIKLKHELDRLILLSDNIVFEWKFTKLLLNSNEKTFKKWPYHYTSWDTNMLLVPSGVGDPENAHRAYKDVELLYNKLKQAYSILGFTNVQ